MTGRRVESAGVLFENLLALFRNSNEKEYLCVRRVERRAVVAFNPATP